MRVFDIEQKTDIRQPLFPAPVVGIVQHKDFQGRQVAIARRRHAARHPAGEGVIGDDHPVFELGGLPAFALGQMPGRDDPP